MPLLFVVFINDVPDTLLSRNPFSYARLCYAYTFKIFKQIRTLNDCVLLQADIHKLVDWCDSNDLELNVGSDYTISVEMLKKVSEIKDLVVIFDSKLWFDKHVNYVFRKCSELFGFIFRVCVQPLT